uniref:Putative secreted protein n=1 Tax=Anopheles darlingi TaxID=43151 RepID=A0A2M4D9T1_ANODA
MLRMLERCPVFCISSIFLLFLFPVPSKKAKPKAWCRSVYTRGIRFCSAGRARCVAMDPCRHPIGHPRNAPRL